MNVLSNITKEILSFDYLDIKVKNLINKINDSLKNKKVLKQINFKINDEAYNNRELVKNTWENAIFINSDDSDDSSDYDSKSVDILPKNKNHKMILEIKKLLEDINNKSYLFKQPTKYIDV